MLNELEESKCTDFNFVALYKAKGIKTSDGILGLAPLNKKAKRNNFNYLKSLKEAGIIDDAIVSFSLSSVKSP